MMVTLKKIRRENDISRLRFLSTPTEPTGTTMVKARKTKVAANTLAYHRDTVYVRSCLWLLAVYSEGKSRDEKT